MENQVQVRVCQVQVSSPEVSSPSPSPSPQVSSLSPSPKKRDSSGNRVQVLDSSTTSLLTGSKKSNMAESRTGSTYISPCRHDWCIYSTTIFMFLWFSCSIGMMKLLYGLNGSRWRPSSKLVDKIEMKFQR